MNFNERFRGKTSIVGKQGMNDLLLSTNDSKKIEKIADFNNNGQNYNLKKQQIYQKQQNNQQNVVNKLKSDRDNDLLRKNGSNVFSNQSKVNQEDLKLGLNSEKSQNNNAGEKKGNQRKFHYHRSLSERQININPKVQQKREEPGKKRMSQNLNINLNSFAPIDKSPYYQDNNSSNNTPVHHQKNYLSSPYNMFQAGQNMGQHNNDLNPMMIHSHFQNNAHLRGMNQNWVPSQKKQNDQESFSSKMKFHQMYDHYDDQSSLTPQSRYSKQDQISYQIEEIRSKKDLYNGNKKYEGFMSPQNSPFQNNYYQQNNNNQKNFLMNSQNLQMNQNYNISKNYIRQSEHNLKHQAFRMKDLDNQYNYLHQNAKSILENSQIKQQQLY